jgi:ATP-dependent DNA helicase RecG
MQSRCAGDAQLAVGTHALIEDKVDFARLGLAIVDEQHRFGVRQRLALRQKGKASGAIPHQLMMSATPIPRTLAMSYYADLDVSVLDELPPGRTPVPPSWLPMPAATKSLHGCRTPAVAVVRPTGSAR